jgi:23S rRNA pseudouridine2605 synthase
MSPTVASVRLQKVLATAGIASRRAAEAMIAAGRVRVDGRVVTEQGTRVDAKISRVEVDGQRVVRQASVYLVLHKPRGVMSTMRDPEGRPTVRELLTDVSAARVYPVGRLDFNTSGVLLATNDGDFAEALLHPRRSAPKVYVVKVNGVMQERDVDLWRRGVELEDGRTLPSKVKLLRYEGDKTWLELTITEGRNQQVRRMGDVTGFRVMRLARLSFAGITSEGLMPGRWRYLTADELTDIKAQFGVPRRVVSPPKPKAAPKALPLPVRRPSGRQGQGHASNPVRGPRHDAATDGHPRYGGGAPVRRDLNTREDWGGGIRRGASEPRDDDSPPRHDLGRGRSRTTGTGGGIGASGPGDTYRVKGRR